MVKGILAYCRRAFCAKMRMMACQSMRNGCAKASLNPFLSTFLLFFFHWKPARQDALAFATWLFFSPSPSADLSPPRAAASHCCLFRPTPAGVFYVGVSAAAPTPNKISWLSRNARMYVLHKGSPLRLRPLIILLGQNLSMTLKKALNIMS